VSIIPGEFSVSSRVRGKVSTLEEAIFSSRALEPLLHHDRPPAFDSDHSGIFLPFCSPSCSIFVCSLQQGLLVVQEMLPR